MKHGAAGWKEMQRRQGPSSGSTSADGRESFWLIYFATMCCLHAARAEKISNAVQILLHTWDPLLSTEGNQSYTHAHADG